MCDQLGGRVTLSEHQEFGRAFVDILDECLLFDGLWPKGGREQVWMSHGDKVDTLPAGFRSVAASEAAPFAAIADDSRRFYGALFHPEVAHTPQGAELLRNFTHNVAGCRGDWTMAQFHTQAIDQIRRQVGTAMSSRPVRRGRFGGRRRPAARGDRRPADLHLCRHRDVALGRGRGGRRAVPPPLQHPARPSRRRRTVFVKLGGVTDPEEKRKRSAPPLSTSSTRRRTNSAMSNFWPKEPSIPT